MRVKYNTVWFNYASYSHTDLYICASYVKFKQLYVQFDKLWFNP